MQSGATLRVSEEKGLCACGERGEQMRRPPSCCDFCGFPQVVAEYPTDREGSNWYGCLECAEFIDRADWDRLIQRGLAAYAQIRAIPDDEEAILRQQVENRVRTFRSVRLVTV